MPESFLMRQKSRQHLLAAVSDHMFAIASHVALATILSKTGFPVICGGSPSNCSQFNNSSAFRIAVPQNAVFTASCNSAQVVFGLMMSLTFSFVTCLTANDGNRRGPHVGPDEFDGHGPALCSFQCQGLLAEMTAGFKHFRQIFHSRFLSC